MIPVPGTPRARTAVLLYRFQSERIFIAEAVITATNTHTSTTDSWLTMMDIQKVRRLMQMDNINFTTFCVSCR